jgi:hypothetical protein
VEEKDMLNVLNTLKDTPIPTILVVAGIVFILLAIAGQFKLLEIPPLVSLWQKWLTGIIGSLLILGGLLIYLRPGLTTVEWIGLFVAVIVILIVLFVILRLLAHVPAEDRAYNDVLEEIKSNLNTKKSELPHSADERNRGSVLIRAGKEMEGHTVTITGRKAVPHPLTVEQRGQVYIATWENVLCDTYTVETRAPDPPKSQTKKVSPWQVAEFDLR